MVKAVGGVGMITDLINQIIVGVNPVEWELSTIVNGYKDKGDSLERGNYRGLKLTVQILKIADRFIQKMTRQQVDIDDMHYGFMPGYLITNVTFISRQLQEKYLAKKNSYFVFVDLGEAFDRVPRDAVWWALKKPSVQPILYNQCTQMYYCTSNVNKCSKLCES